jgi:transposase
LDARLNYFIITTMSSANKPHRGARVGSEFFTDPQGAAHRRYEALRAYFLEGQTAATVAERFGYTTGSVQAMVRDFRNGDTDLFVTRRPGPRTAPAKQAAHDQVLRLRAQGLSVTDIADALAGTDTPLNRTGVWELLRDEGFERLAPRPPGARGARRDHPPRTGPIDWPEVPVSLQADYAGALLLLPGLVELDLPGAVDHAKLPGTRQIPALNSVLSLLALKTIGRRRVSHVDDVAVDPALAAFAGMDTLPKATALGSYSYKLDRSHDARLLEALAPRMLATGQTDGKDIDLDFHAIMHYGDDVALETHYVPRRSQRTESVLTLFAQDGQTRNLVYANADIHKATQADEVMRFVHHWRAATGTSPELLVFDSKVTTGAGLADIDAEGIRFLTLRQRSPKIIERLEALPDEAWTTVTLDRKGRYRKPQIHEDIVHVRGCPTPLRQIAVRGLGHDHPTLILTNDFDAKPGWLVNRYAKRMAIEQRLAEAIRSFHLDALSSSVALNVDLDATLTVWAHAAYDLLRRQLTGYQTATPDTIWRRFVSTRGRVTLGPDGIVARLDNRTYSPVLRTAQLPPVEIPWWNGRTLTIEIGQPTPT